MKSFIGRRCLSTSLIANPWSASSIGSANQDSSSSGYLMVRMAPWSPCETSLRNWQRYVGPGAIAALHSRQTSRSCEHWYQVAQPEMPHLPPRTFIFRAIFSHFCLRTATGQLSGANRGLAYRAASAHVFSLVPCFWIIAWYLTPLSPCLSLTLLWASSVA